MRKIKRVINEGFVSSIITLTSGSLIAQSLTILIAPILTRIFSPEELGVYTLIITAESLFGAIICARYDVSIVSEPDEKKIFPLIKLSIIIALVFSIIASIGYGYFYFINNDDYRKYSYAIIFIFIMLLVNGLLRILEAYNNRNREYKIITAVYIIRSSAQNFGAVILGVFKLGVLGLIISHISSLFLGLKKQSQKLTPYMRKLCQINFSQLKEVSKLHYRQPLYSTPAIFANKFSYTSLALFIEALFGLVTLGFYSISYRALGVPLNVVSNNIAKVFYQRASREYDETGKFIKTFKKTVVILLIIAIPMVMVLFFLAPIIFEVVFGSVWREAGIYVKILAPMFGVRLIVSSITYGLQIVRRQKLELILQTMFIVSSILSFIVSKVLLLNVFQFLILISLLFSVSYLVYFCIVLKYAVGNSQ